MSPTSPTRSLFGSLRDKLSSKKTRGRSPSPNRSFDTPASTKPQSSNDLPPPPPYSVVDFDNIAGPSSAPPTPSITLNSTPIAREPSPAPSFASARSDPSITSPEDPYAFLTSFDTIFLVDDSGSMAGKSWREVKAALRAIAPICTSHDANGIDIYFLHARNHGRGANEAWGYCNITTVAQVEALFNTVRPTGATPTGTRINNILKPYLREYERAVRRTGNPDECGVKPVNMIVITDGVPTDDPESVIISVAKKLDALEAPPHQVGIQFFQVGNEKGAADALKELDDGLAEQGGGVRDLVDTVSWEGGAVRELSADAILKVVLGAVVKRLDRRRIDGDSRRRNRLSP
jgi:uncharacterized protein YegL